MVAARRAGCDPFCECDRGSCGRVRRKQYEFIATYPRPCIRHSERIAHALRYGLEGSIADLVTVPIVDALEAVEIDGHERKRLA